MKIPTLICFALLICGPLFSQKTITINGSVTNIDKQPLDFINVSIKNSSEGTITDSKGNFQFTTKQKPPFVLSFSSIGFHLLEIEITRKEQLTELKAVMKRKTEEIGAVDVTGKNQQSHSFTRIDSKLAGTLPDASGGNIESLVKTQIGVTSNNELSSQYRVRGGNYDENLVYVNDIEIYRPFLTRSGQQEGLSFVNPDMVSSLQFSAGGFDARYGDKMSSVLDIDYKKPTKYAGSATASLLGAMGHLEGRSKNKRFTHISGIRYKTSTYLLGSLDISGEYNPKFIDFQTYLTYDISNKLEIGFLGNFSQNDYNFEPVDRETTFGTISEVKQLKIYFDGQELDRFVTGFGALNLTYHPNEKNEYKLIASAFRTHEKETFDILGEYWLQDMTEASDTDFDKNQPVAGIGVGSYMEHARNELFGTVTNLAIRGAHQMQNDHLSWELKYQAEIFDDHLNEWERRDSSGYSLPFSDEEIRLPYAYNAEIDINSTRLTGFIQDNHKFNIANGSLNLTAGVRANYWDFNNELLISPRASLMYTPQWEKEYRFRLATGLYYQSPFYKELRTPEGKINHELKAQKSYHLVLGSDRYMTIWNRPFKFSTEIYYKYMDNLIPYTVDNVRIRYQGTNNAKGYSTGIDMKINGEFVKGVESWASISLMQSEEDINDDAYFTTDTDGNSTEVFPGYIPRPSDQRLNFALFFQDYLPNNPSFKVHLNLLFGSGLPFGPPNSERYQANNRMPAYRRVDIGFSKELSGSQKHPDRVLGPLKSLWLGVEVFNLFDINNTISYFWVTDIQNRQYAVPNYLTSRRLNVKLVARF